MRKLLTKSVDSKHPICIAELLKDKYGKDIQFEFSRYIYYPQTIEDNREVFRINANDLNHFFLENEIKSLDDKQELSFHSKVYFPNNKVLHIPMVDFRCQEFRDIEWHLMKKVLSKDILKYFFIYDSGTSFHGYSLHLLTPKQWLDYMLDLIVALESIVDYRWVAHRMKAGYSSLRWSNKTKKLPQLKGFYAKDVVTNITESQCLCSNNNIQAIPIY